MKLNYIKYTLLLAACFFLHTINYAQDKGYKQTMDMTVDEKGEVGVISSIKYNASTWDYVKQQHGTDPSVLRNAIKKQFPKYLLTDFDIKSDDMERTSTIKFKMLGGLKVDANGKWMADMESKNPDVTKLSETQFLLVDEQSAQTSKIHLPASATDAKIEKDAFGKAILTFNAPVSGGGMSNIFKYIGILLAAGGAFLFFKNKNSVNTVTSSSKNIQYRPAKHIDDAIVMPHQFNKENVKSNNNNS